MTRPPFRRRRVGRRLREMREQAGVTLEEAALALDEKRSSMYRIEAGESPEVFVVECPKRDCSEKTGVRLAFPAEARKRFLCR